MPRCLLPFLARRHHDETGAVAQELLDNEPSSALPGARGVGAVSWIAERTDGYSGSDLMELCSQVSGRGSGSERKALVDVRLRGALWITAAAV